MFTSFLFLQSSERNWVVRSEGKVQCKVSAHAAPGIWDVGNGRRKTWWAGSWGILGQLLDTSRPGRPFSCGVAAWRAEGATLPSSPALEQQGLRQCWSETGPHFPSNQSGQAASGPREALWGFAQGRARFSASTNILGQLFWVPMQSTIGKWKWVRLLPAPQGPTV